MSESERKRLKAWYKTPNGKAFKRRKVELEYKLLWGKYVKKGK